MKEDNVILLTTSFDSTDRGLDYLLDAFDREKNALLLVNTFGNGESSSPSNFIGKYPSLVTQKDNVRIQHKLLESLEIHTLKLVTTISKFRVETFGVPRQTK